MLIICANTKNGGDKMEQLPLGLGMALAQNQDAMEYFAKLPQEKKDEIINHTHSIQSKQEMHSFVQNLTNNI